MGRMLDDVINSLQFNLIYTQLPQSNTWAENVQGLAAILETLGQVELGG